LEGIAQPGAICLSEDAYRQVRARLDLEVNDLGQPQLKNIVEPVRVYSLQVGLPAQAKGAAPVAPATEEKPAPRLALPDKLSIAVLPFQNMSGDLEQEYFADGMVEDIITALFARSLAVRDRAQFQLHLQGQGGRHQAGRAGTRRPLRP
jgi:adenylate cyclase